MDYDVASWVAEEASRGADPRGGAQIPSTAGPKAHTPGARFGAPPTPSTPAGAGVGAGEPGAFATEMFLRRVREPGASPSPVPPPNPSAIAPRAIARARIPASPVPRPLPPRAVPPVSPRD